MMRPFIRAAFPSGLAELGRAMHPLRLQRALMAGTNPWMFLWTVMAQQVQAQRKALQERNPFAEIENAGADLIEQSMDLQRDLSDMGRELTFFGLWAAPAAYSYGKSHAGGRTLKDIRELIGLPEAQMALARISQGGFVEAVIRMLIMLAESRGGVRRDRLERSSHVLTMDEPFASLTQDQRSLIIREQTLVVTLAQEEAMATLPDLLRTSEERARALSVVRYVPGRLDEMAPHTVETLSRMAEVLGQPPITDDVLDDPLASKAPLQATSKSEARKTQSARRGTKA
jgi:tellurite resistance protein